jgi:hypothetical protein
MLISGRESCALLAEAGVTRRQAQRVLAAGLAGDPVRTRSACLYDEADVRALVDTRVVSWREMSERCPYGFFIARRHVSAVADRAEQLAVVSTGWGAISPYRLLDLRMQLDAVGAIPFVATVAGFVVLGADIRGVWRGALELGEPGGWFDDDLATARLPSGPGRPWVLQIGDRVRIAA